MERALPKFILIACTVLWIPFLACSHARATGGVQSLKNAGDTFLQRLRWRDFRGAAELIVPERRARFERVITQFADDSDLTITDYQLEDVRLSPAQPTRGWVIARVRWVRLPSVSEKNAVISSEFVYRDGVWFLGRQDKGPFADVLSERLPDTDAP